MMRFVEDHETDIGAQINIRLYATLSCALVFKRMYEYLHDATRQGALGEL